ncbi:Glycosyltransferase involved in cell wall bisynthesis [Parapedobacter luteus]|uniref:Glycosyltransferase involved in cell wall bisynthesis n=1 Tax=Parapedobacter luteus TaxID=623280 RepID=A0A1T5DFQ2_9SPHI|nr:glycosyltransferase [Parapedobacter luteus]SKB70578.1 Glycosyltransferase involved in cell wall bisynthesis [Parapedobacter luteus]
MTDISIITPCYNSGDFLQDAVDSVMQYQGIHRYELIIVDDGSTDESTLQILRHLATQQSITVIHQDNKGPAGARNTGCRAAKGEYLLFLDSDNKIEPRYIDAGIDILRNKAEIGVVYSDAHFFGDGSRKSFKTRPFDIDRLLLGNYIDMCAVVRKAAWESVNGFDESRNIVAHEDWDFWLNLYEKDWGFQYIDRRLFYYRIREASLISSVRNSDTIVDKLNHIRHKHSALFVQRHKTLYEKMRKEQQEYRIGRLILKPYRALRKWTKK